MSTSMVYTLDKAGKGADAVNVDDAKTDDDVEMTWKILLTVPALPKRSTNKQKRCNRREGIVYAIVALIFSQ